MAEYYVDNARNGGVPLVQETTSNCSINAGDVTRLDGSSGDFVNVQVGDPFWITSSGTGGNTTIGVYIVQAIDSADQAYVTLDRAGGTAGETGVDTAHTPYDGTADADNIAGSAGPYATIQYALDHTPNGQRINIKANSGYLFDNLDQPVIGSALLVCDAFGGNIAGGTFGVMEGYSTEIGDGGSVELDGDGGNRAGIQIDGVENLEVRNITCGKLANNPGNVAWDIGPTSLCKNITLINCQGNQARGGLVTADVDGLVLIEFEASDNGANGIYLEHPAVLVNVKANGNSSAGIAVNNTLVTMLNCVVYGNTGDGILVLGAGRVLIHNCTVWGNGDDGIVVGSATSMCRVINTISAGNGGKNFDRENGTLWGDYCCSDDDVGDNWTAGASCVEANPRFRDAGNGDLLPRYSKLLEAGMPDVNGIMHPMGAVGRAMRSGKGALSTAGSPVTGTF